MVVNQGKHEGELPSYAFDVGGLLDLVHAEGPYQYVRSGKQDVR